MKSRIDSQISIEHQDYVTHLAAQSSSLALLLVLLGLLGGVFWSVFIFGAYAGFLPGGVFWSVFFFGASDGSFRPAGRGIFVYVSLDFDVSTPEFGLSLVLVRLSLFAGCPYCWGGLSRALVCVLGGCYWEVFAALLLPF